MTKATLKDRLASTLQPTAWGAALGLTLLAAPTHALSGKPLTLRDFGPGGSRLPAIASQFVSEDFYTADMVGPLASRQYYSAYFEVPREIERPGKDLASAGFKRFETHKIAQPNLILTFENTTENINDIVLSVFGSAGDSRNYLIRVGAGESLRVQTGSLADARSIALLSFLDFGAGIQVFDRQQSLAQLNLDVMAPLETASTAPHKLLNYCQEVNETIRITADSTGGYVFAKAIRTKNQFSTEPYYLEIEYPAGTLFHEQSSVGWNINPPLCLMDNYGTRRVSDSSITHRWLGMDNLLLFCNGPGTAECLTGCNETFTVVLAGLSLGKCF